MKSNTWFSVLYKSASKLYPIQLAIFKTSHSGGGSLLKGANRMLLSSRGIAAVTSSDLSSSILRLIFLVPSTNSIIFLSSAHLATHSMKSGHPFALSCTTSSSRWSIVTFLSLTPSSTRRYSCVSYFSNGVSLTWMAFRLRFDAADVMVGESREDTMSIIWEHSALARCMSSARRLQEDGSISPSPSRIIMRGCSSFSIFISESTMLLVLALGLSPLKRDRSCASATVGTMLPMLTLSVLLKMF
mmetsp:Transcript_54165/g.115096  ORF Transcript_54165/g.115096 Transcript_54165/m.115096 type:complete len:244 (-) Transcript_54165:691-1422(-)